MSKKLVIILANSDPRNPEEFSAPLFQAAVAAAMSHEVEVVFTRLAGVCAIAGNASEAMINVQELHTMYDAIKEARQWG